MMDIVVWFEDHQGTAAWVQTFGALLALAVAIGFPIAQQRSTESREKRERQAKLVQQVGFILAGGLVIRQEMSRAREFLKDADQRIDHRPYNDHEVLDALESLNGFPLHDLPNTEMVITAVQLRGVCRTLVSEMNAQLDYAISTQLNVKNLPLTPFDNVYGWFEHRLGKWESMHLELIGGLHRHPRSWRFWRRP